MGEASTGPVTTSVAEAVKLRHPDRLFIAGRWVPPVAGALAQEAK